MGYKKVIGLTGGIASGKSTVGRLFAAKGVPIIDTDAISRDLTLHNQTVKDKIIKTFGSINKAQLKKIIFNNPHQKKLLEQILHPVIQRQMLEEIKNANSPLVVVEIPLLFEVGWQDLVDVVLLVASEDHLKLQRIINRDGLSKAQAQKIIASQLSDQAKVSLSDEVIYNNDDLDKLAHKVDVLYTKYKKQQISLSFAD